MWLPIRGTSDMTEATHFSQCVHDQQRRLEAEDCDSHARETAVTQTLPIACGQSHEHILSHQKLGDSFLLFRLKRWIPKTSRCLSNVANATPSVSFSSVHVYGGNRGIRNTWRHSNLAIWLVCTVGCKGHKSRIGAVPGLPFFAKAWWREAKLGPGGQWLQQWVPGGADRSAPRRV